MNAMTEKARQVAARLLKDGTVDRIVGWVKGDEPYISAPAVIDSAEAAERLVFDEFCIHDLANVLLEHRDGHDKFGVFVKGCDSRGVVRLLQDKAFARERLYLIGIPCSGQKDPNQYLITESGIGRSAITDLAPKCVSCQVPNPVLYDEMIGENQSARSDERFAQLEITEAMSPDERYAFFTREFEKCIRCYACRNICIACNCRTCIFDETRPQWVGRASDPVNNILYQIIRANHVAGRCVECGECERACPAGIPLMLFNRRLIKDVDRFFGPYQAGMSLEDDARPPLSRYSVDDPDEFK
ncbi:MAG: 4Fe-4S dicluster domain-containing protein [Solirubrobacterales bacterium]